jgi:chemotaxis protein CheD
VADTATPTVSEVVVRMGELAVSSAAGDVLVSVGLGSCIGLALLCRRARVGGLAHVMLPASSGRPTDNAAKFADSAVPALLAAVRSGEARPEALEAVLVGGAQMFASSAGMDIGARNEAAVREALAGAGIPVTATATAGSTGRTVRLHVASGVVTVREAGAQEVELR